MGPSERWEEWIPGLRLQRIPKMTTTDKAPHDGNHPTSRSTASTAFRSSAVKAFWGGTGSPTS